MLMECDRTRPMYHRNAKTENNVKRYAENGRNNGLKNIICLYDDNNNLYT